MTKEEILEGNKLIAEFLGYIYVPYTAGHSGRPHGWVLKNYKLIDKKTPKLFLGRTAKDLLYHKSWDWLMPCVEKIEHLKEDVYSLGRIEINSHHCRISSLCKNQPYIIVGCYKESPEKVKTNSKLEAVYLAVITFIKWYNEKFSE